MTNPTEAPMANAIDDVKLLPCPFCGDAMEMHFDVIRHQVQGDCPIGAYAWADKYIDGWNRRASPARSQHTGWSDEAVEVYIESADHTITTTRAAALDDLQSLIGQGWDAHTEAHLMMARAALAASSIAPATGFEVSEQFKAGYEEGFRDGSNAVRTAGVGPEGGADQVDEIFSWLEKQAKESRTGISFDWVPACDGDPSGWRFMRRHFISNAKKSLRQAVMAAMEYNVGKSFK